MSVHSELPSISNADAVAANAASRLRIRMVFLDVLPTREDTQSAALILSVTI